MLMFYTYIHSRADSGKVFYVGKGHGTRAWQKKGRNNYWQRICQKHGLRVDIAANWGSESEAFQHEKFLIACFRDMGMAEANICDGGQGSGGFKHSEEFKKMISEKLKGRPGPPRTAEQKERIANKLRGRKVANPRRLTKEEIERRTKTRLERVKRYEEGGYSLSIREWEKMLGVHYSTVQYRLKKGLPLLEVSPRGPRAQKGGA